MTNPLVAGNNRALIEVLKAADRAAKWHAQDKHKGVSGVPYINHLIEVSLMVTTATDGSDPTLTIAALLHDAVEKAGIPPSQIKSEFGDEVYELVMEVTDDASLSKARRQERQIATASQKSLRAKLLTLADKTSNLRALSEYAPNSKQDDNPLEYAEWAEKVVQGVRGVSPWLEDQFDQALAAVRLKISQVEGGSVASARR